MNRKDDNVVDNQKRSWQDFTLPANDSLNTLINWNILKAMENNPILDLKEAIKVVQKQLEGEVADVYAIMIHQDPEERHLTCAWLAWQQLGHSGVESLCRFIEESKKNPSICTESHQSDLVYDNKNTNEPIKFNTGNLDLTDKSKNPNEKNGVIIKDVDSQSQPQLDDSFSSPINDNCIIIKDDDFQTQTKLNGSFSNPIKNNCHLDFQTQSKLDGSFSNPIKNNCAFVKGEDFRTQRKLDGSFASPRRWPSYRPCSSKDENPMGYERSSTPAGPVLRLPNTTSVVMRLENTPRARQPPSPNQTTAQKEKNLLKKINEVCCLESGCVDRLAKMEDTTRDLKQRATKLAQREAERVALLERAEAAWRDLELNYQKRLRLSLEKEEDIARQMMKTIDERNGFKESCETLVEQLKQRSDCAEKERDRLTALEKELCGRACDRLKVSEESTREEAALADNLCKAAQMDRDLQFKEEQARRKMQCLESAIEIARSLKFEAGRAMYSELAGMRDQINLVSTQLLEEDTLINNIKAELDELREEKREIVEDLEGCKALCDSHLTENMDKLTKKREELEKLKDKVVECRCKMPVDVTIQAKRTPSLAALCECSAEERLLDSCSCSSLRGQLLSNLLADLFCGLQSELGTSGAQMPCQLLKCLEDKHNWDKASVVKSNLKSFFSRLLVCELDIAIATAIEKYHARWVGTTCADPRLVPGPGVQLPEGWQQRVIESKAQQLATKLAEQMFEQKADELTQRAKDTMKAAAPLCDCKPNDTQATFQCLLQRSLGDGMSLLTSHSTNTYDQPLNWKRACTDVTQLRLEVENLKNESIKKHDLKAMEKEIAKLVFLSSEPSCEVLLERKREISKRNSLQAEPVLTSHEKQVKNVIRTSPIKKTGNAPAKNQRRNFPTSNATTDKQTCKSYKRPAQTYAVNVCLCSTKEPQKLKHKRNTKISDEDKTAWQQTEIVSKTSCIKQAKPIAQLQSHTQQDYEELKSNKHSIEETCKRSCICFNKVPSNTSIDKLLQALTKWTYNWSENIVDDKCLLKERATEKQNLNSKNAITEPQLNILTCQGNAAKNSLNNEIVLSYNVSNQTNQNCIELDSEFPLATDSEYMGAVNLDKSNEVVCKYQDTLEKPGELKSNAVATSIKCIKSCNSNKKTETSKPMDSSSEVHKKCVLDMPKSLEQNIKEPQCKEQHSKGKLGKESPKADNFLDASYHVNDQEVNIFTSFKNITTEIKEDILKYLNDHCEIKSNLKKISDKEQNTFAPINTNHKVQTSDSCDNDYHIEFLGVTLTSENCDDKHAKNEDKFYKIENTSTQTKSNDESILSEELHSQLYWQNIKNTFPSLCQCNRKINEIKNFFDKSNIKQHGDYSRYEDKAFDTESLTKTIKTKKSCVCCHNTEKDNTNDLEVNTFQLLEEHLKKKLEDLKLSCTPFCLPTKEEDKLYSALIEKIKQVIVDSTDKVSCKCSEKQEIEGSWNRAYNLLQEYLKVKMSRVKCLCGSSSDDKEIMPKVVEKVCSLIEKDFQRLKDKFQNIRKQIHYKNNNNEVEIETPEKDTSTSEVIILEDAANLNCCLKYLDSSCSPANATTSVFNKTSPMYRLENKGCDPVVYSNMLMTTQELQAIGDQLDPKIGDSCSNTAFSNSKLELTEITTTVQCAEVLTKNIHSSIYESNKDSLVDDKEESNKVMKELALPYIGYTVECSCGHKLGFCTCNRASVLRYNDNVQHIWQAFTSNKICRNYSYIMNNVHKKVDSVCYVDVTDNPLLPNMVKVDNTTQFSRISAGNVCDIKTSYTEGEIVLKDSKIENEKKYIENTTGTTDGGSIVKAVYKDDDILQWYECGSQCKVGQQVTKIKSVRFDKDNFDIAKSKTFLDNCENQQQLSINVTQDCDCSMVPICHVKMLVDNIENRLIHSECTCDSMSAKVCPVHSIQNNDIE